MERELKNPKLLYSLILSEVASFLNQYDDYSVKSENNCLQETKKLCKWFSTLFFFFERNKDVYYDEFYYLVEKNITNESLKDEIFSIRPKYSKRGFLTKNNRSGLYKGILTIFNDKLSKIIDDNLDLLKELFAHNPAGLVQTFLSYSYADKGLTLILFFYFLKNGGYLYMDWMYSPAYPNGIAIKDSLNDALSASSQLLFLYTPNSEMKTKDRRSLKEWCSWEFGSFYPRKEHAKFYTRMPNNYSEYKIPDILDTFKEMYMVQNGVIYGQRRRVMDFYIPNEEEFSHIVLNLLIDYVNPLYTEFDRFEVCSKSANKKIFYDAYNMKTDTALEFKLILDGANRNVKGDFLFKSNGATIYNNDKNTSEVLKRVLIAAVNQLKNYGCNTELIIAMPNRYSSSLLESEEKRLLEEIDLIRSEKMRKVYFVYVDSIHKLSFGKKKKIKKYYYIEKDI